MNLPIGKITQLRLYLTAIEAYDLIQTDDKNILFIDVRTQAELAFVGVPTMIDANIPYEVIEDWNQWDDKGKTFKMSVNQNFVKAFEKRISDKCLNKQSIVILICRSGYRSASATDLLTNIGYKNVYNLIDGFEGDTASSGSKKGQRVINGWKNSNLPWSIQLDKTKMYFDVSSN
jgi:rhodanese-related sulfurtransferase